MLYEVITFDGQLQRRVHGVVSQFAQGDTGFRRTRYQLEVRPALWRLGLRHNSRIFQALTPQEIISVLRITSYNVCYTKLLRGIVAVHDIAEVAP